MSVTVPFGSKYLGTIRIAAGIPFLVAERTALAHVLVSVADARKCLGAVVGKAAETLWRPRRVGGG